MKVLSMSPQAIDNQALKCTVGILLPTYCEASNLEKIVEHIESLPLKSEILIVDDSSPDGTSDVVRFLQKNIPT
jgi:glycosyltransferase involved in cell wall biosynthesis